MGTGILLILMGYLLVLSAPKDRNFKDIERGHFPPGLEIASQKALENGKKQLKKGHCKQAIHEFNKAIQKDPKNFDAQYWLSIAEGMCGYNKEALERLKISREFSPTEVWTSRVLSTIGIILYSMGKEEEAKKYMEMARKIDPNNELVIFWKGDSKQAYDLILRWLE